METTNSVHLCPLRDQTGAEAILDFEGVLERMSPELRAIFEDERTARAAEYAAIVSEIGYNT